MIILDGMMSEYELKASPEMFNERVSSSYHGSNKIDFY